MSQLLELFSKFVSKPDRDSFLAVHGALVESEQYDPYSNEFEEIEALVADNNFDEACEKLGEAMPNLLLSPRAHLLSSFIAEKRNEKKSVQTAYLIAAACCHGIIATGDGTKAAPYTVTRASDEYDIMQFLEKEFKGQSMYHDGDRHFDLVEFADGSQMWFDISNAYEKLGENI